jgi:DNA mismatch endonuclease (patch repair protein)
MSASSTSFRSALLRKFTVAANAKPDGPRSRVAAGNQPDGHQEDDQPDPAEEVQPSIPARRHRGDIMSPETRSRVMSRIRGKDTGPELLLAQGLAGQGLEWESNSRDLPGRPDFVFRSAKVAVFVDGDFWHGWNFGRWRHKLSERWEAKIASNRHRDRLNDGALREMGWQIVRIWEHQIEASLARCAGRVVRAIIRATAGTNDNRDIDAAREARQRVSLIRGGAMDVDEGT